MSVYRYHYNFCELIDKLWFGQLSFSNISLVGHINSMRNSDVACCMRRVFDVCVSKIIGVWCELDISRRKWEVH